MSTSFKVINYISEFATIPYVDSKIISNDNSLNISSETNLTCIGRKNQTIPVNSAASIYSYSGGPGILKRLWLALNGPNPGIVFIRIYCDGVLCFGNMSTNTGLSGLNVIPMATDFLFAPTGTTVTASNSYANSLQGCNVFDSASLGGYCTFNMPFQNSIDIQLFNNSSTIPVSYWVQPFVLTNVNIPSSLSSMKLYTSTFRYINTSYGSEYLLLNIADNGNGIYLKYIRAHIVGLSGIWGESRLRIYDGVNSPTNTNGVITPWTPYSANNYTTFPGYDSTSKCIFVSSGLEDAYLSSWNGINSPPTLKTSASGILHQSDSSIISTSIISWYRNFDQSEGMPYASNGRMVVSLNSGDAQVGVSGVYSALLGVCYYYA